VKNNPAVPARNLINQSGPWRKRWNVRGLYLLAAIPIAYVIVFNYVPMYGVLMAFKRFQPRLGVWGSPWVGLYNFQRLFNSPNFFGILRNTLVISFYGLIAGFPFPILMAICINHFMLKRFTKAVQTITFAPHFLSAVILVGFIGQILSLRSGAVNLAIRALGFQQINFMGIANLFPHIYVWSGIWQNTGYSAIIYISALVAVDPNLHEAGIIDGATLWQRVWYIDLATIRPIIIIMLILSMGGILATNFEKAYLLQNPLNTETSEVISTYVYKVGLASSRPDYSFGTAIGLFQNVIGVILTLTVNKLANVLTGEGMF
jgi:multiple sugar transport system permease protein/putative aldouronate transport system permease protein